MSDRTVHAWGNNEFGQRLEVVRYDRSGKWRVEPTPGAGHTVNVHRAASAAVTLWYEGEGSVEFGRAGGRVFDRAVKDLVLGKRGPDEEGAT